MLSLHLDWIRRATRDHRHGLRRGSGLDGAVTLGDVERLLFALGAFPHDAVHQVRAPALPTDLVGRRAEDAYRAFGEGCTLVLRSAHDRLPVIATLAGELAHELRMEVRANLYLTPPGSQGFVAHFDRHDVLVLQLAGDKHWNLFAHVGHRPLSPPLLSAPQKLLYDSVLAPDGKFSTDDAETVVVGPGDLLSIPSGVPHQAVAADGPSLHCTFALLHPSRAEALSLAVFAGAARDHGMLEQWDPSAELAAPAQDHVAAEAAEYAFALLRQQSRLPLPGRYLETLCAIDAVAADSQLERRPGVRPWIGSIGGVRQFLFTDNRFLVSAMLEETFEFLLATERFRAGELPIARAGFDPVELCRDLIRRGLLQIVAE